MTSPLILVTNDDGIDSPGLHAAVAAVADLGDVLIVAPVFQQTSMSRARPVGTMMGVVEVRELRVNGTRYTVHAVHGSPVHAILHAVFELADRKPNLCISGINYGENLGASITQSGTVGAALEASSLGIPSLAIANEVDLDQQHASSYALINCDVAALATHRLAACLLRQGLPATARLLNVNIPRTATAQTPFRLTVQSNQNYYQPLPPPMRSDLSTPYRFVSHIRVDLDALEPESDIYAFAIDRVISVTPLQLNLTAYQAVEAWKENDHSQFV